MLQKYRQKVEHVAVNRSKGLGRGGARKEDVRKGTVMLARWALITDPQVMVVMIKCQPHLVRFRHL